MAVVSSSAWDTKFLLVTACVAAWGCLDHSWTPGFLNFCDAFEAVFPVAQLVKNPPTMQETLVQFLGQEDPWRREQLPTLVLLPGEFYGQRSLVSYKSTESQRVRHD